MKTIIFDFDGTLADTINLSIKCIKLLSEKYDLKSIPEIEKVRNKSLLKIIKEDLELPWFKIIFFVKELQLLLENQIDEIKLFPKIKDVLKQLSKKYKLGIVTSNSSLIVKELLKKDSLNMFSFIQSDESLLGKGKILKKIIKKQNLNPKETFYIGDEVRDITAAREAGIKIISVTWGFNTKEILKENKPDFLVNKPEEIIKVLINCK